MKTRSKKKITNDNDQIEINKYKSAINIDQRQTTKELKQMCIQLVQLIDSSPFEESDRLDFKNGLMAFYESAKLLLKDLTQASSQKEAERVTSNFVELLQNWTLYKNDLLNSIKSPQRTEFISYAYNELLKLSLSVNNLIDHPPITPAFEIQGPKLSRELASEISEALTSYRQLFEQLLNEENITTEMIDSARNPLRKLRQELLSKYQIFFITQDADKPNEFYDEILKYIDRVLKKTQHFSVSNEEAVPAPFRGADDILLQIQNNISNIDPQWENLLPNINSKTSRNNNFLIDNPEKLKTSLKVSFDASSSMTGQSIIRFSNSMTDGFSHTTGIESFLAKSGKVASPAKSTIAASRDPNRMSAPWYQEPLFGAMEHSIKKMNEKLDIISTRSNVKSPIKVTSTNNPGVKDELVNQIKNSKQRLSDTKARVSKHQTQYDSLKESYDRLMENCNFGQNSQRLRIEFQNESDVINHLNFVRSYITQRITELRKENEELKRYDAKQKENGSRQYDEAIQKTQNIVAQNQNNLKEMKLVTANISKLKAENERISIVNTNKQGECNSISEKINELQNRINEGKTVNKTRSSEMESMKAKIKIFSIDKNSINEKGERDNNDFDNQIAELTRFSKKMAKKEYSLQQNVDQAKERNDNLVNKLIPELTYQIEKRAALVRSLSAQALMEKQRVKNLQLQLFAKNLENDQIPFS